MKKSLVALALVAATAQAWALTPGDISVIAYNSDGADNFAWVALTDIAANTTINFTDSSWQGTAFRPTEHLDAGGPLSWSFANTLNAGTVVKYSGATLNTWSTGTAGGVGLSLATGGDQIFAFQGLNSSPSFIYGLQFAHATGIIAAPTVSSSTNTTNVPSALSVAAGTMFNVGNFDDGYYSGITSGSKTELLSAISNTANWTKSDTEYASTSWAGSFAVTAVPEPETYAMLLAGLGLLGAFARKRRA